MTTTHTPTRTPAKSIALLDGSRLRTRGNIALLDRLDQAVTVTGSRAATTYGTDRAADYASLIAGGDVEADRSNRRPVMTGGGFGIEAAATRAALAVGGEVVVVLGSGLDKVHPTAHAPLFDQVVASGGLLVSLVDDDQVPTRTLFRQRTEWIATHTGAVLIVEAAYRSASLVLADQITDPSRLGAVPGPVTSTASAGTNSLIADGRARCIHDHHSLRGLLPLPRA